MDLFEQWQELKPNTQLRVAAWLEAGLPAKYAPIDDLITVAEGSAKFRSEALRAVAADLAALKRSIKAELRSRGIDLMHPPHIPDTSWARQLKGRRRIMWTPPSVSKGED